MELDGTALVNREPGQIGEGVRSSHGQRHRAGVSETSRARSATEIGEMSPGEVSKRD